MYNWDQRQARSKAEASKHWGFNIICASMLETLAYNKGADQPAHPRSLISALVIRCLKSKVIRSVICLLQHEKLSGYAPERRCFRTIKNIDSHPSLPSVGIHVHVSKTTKLSSRHCS